jgi:hypothetical protein
MHIKTEREAFLIDLLRTGASYVALNLKAILWLVAGHSFSHEAEHANQKPGLFFFF